MTQTLVTQNSTFEIRPTTTATELAQQIRGMANRPVHFDIAREVAAELTSGRYTGGQLRTWGIEVRRTH